jgi:hypothetical protein
MRLDTLNTMEKALKIYYENKFYKIEPCYNNPCDGVVYLERTLKKRTANNSEAVLQRNIFK